MNESADSARIDVVASTAQDLGRPAPTEAIESVPGTGRANSGVRGDERRRLVLDRPPALALAEHAGQGTAMIDSVKADGYPLITQRRHRRGCGVSSIRTQWAHQVVSVTERRARQLQAVVALGQGEPPGT